MKQLIDRKILTFIFLIFLSGSVLSEESCTTKDDKPGTCVEIGTCQEDRPIVCSQENGKVYVCCSAKQNKNTPRRQPHLKVRGCGRRTLQLSPRVRRQDEMEMRIIGDDEGVSRYTSLYSWPWIGGLFKKTKEDEALICSVNIISPDYLLTAAHCLHGQTDNKLFVRLGSSNVKNGNPYEVTDIKIHENFNTETFENDIALLRVNSSLEYVPICLPHPRFSNSNLENRTGVILGWGVTGYGKNSSERLREVQIPLMTNQKCRQMYQSRRINITDMMMCGGEEGKDACTGDGGGPLMMEKKGGKWFMMGLVSFGIGCGERNYPGVYTRVSKYLHWIKENTDIGDRRETLS
ncbi:trypsin-1-like [Centruroides sculpturatus]|uniref:trypsin-1-like n=1 Tax=Centruroides sculpturatus TaxID=218467 RepID=UPI000C6CEFEC|nr:trypsin-1-like [Centruroides sculpturatus]XP_023239138.1 trypsin-1-like [Centruroides sculpturatus]